VDDVAKEHEVDEKLTAAEEARRVADQQAAEQAAQMVRDGHVGEEGPDSRDEL
jgi:hypothetical protein